MRSADVIEAIAAVRGDAALVTGPGGMSGASYQLAPESPTIYNMELGYATATALGIALARPDRRAIALEGDGSAIAGMPVLTSVARQRPANLVVVIVDNGIYGTGAGTVETATSHGTDLAAVARGCGIPEERVLTPGDTGALADALGRAVATDGPWVVVVRVEPDDMARSERRPIPGRDFVEAAILFQERFRRD